MLLYGKKLKQCCFFSEIIVYDIKVGRCSQLNEYMKLYEYQRSKSFIDLGPNHSVSIFLIFYSSVISDFNILIYISTQSETGPMVLWFQACPAE